MRLKLLKKSPKEPYSLFRFDLKCVTFRGVSPNGIEWISSAMLVTSD
jgi:hypothetical protein